MKIRRTKSYRIRKKGKYFIVEEMLGNQILQTFSLNPKKTFLMYKMERNDLKNVEEILHNLDKEPRQKYAYDSLNEPSEEDITDSLEEIYKE